MRPKDIEREKWQKTNKIRKSVEIFLKLSKMLEILVFAWDRIRHFLAKNFSHCNHYAVPPLVHPISSSKILSRFLPISSSRVGWKFRIAAASNENASRKVPDVSIYFLTTPSLCWNVCVLEWGNREVSEFCSFQV